MAAPTITAAIDARSGVEKKAPRIIPRAAANKNASKQRTLAEHMQANPLIFDCFLPGIGCELLVPGI